MDERSISERLAVFGIEHESGSDGRRFIRWQGKSLGQMDSAQAENLLALIEINKPTMVRVEEW